MRPPTGLDQLWQLQINLGIDLLGWQKQNCTLGRFTGDDIFGSNIGDMFFHICLKPPPRHITRRLVVGGHELAIGFKRKF